MIRSVSVNQVAVSSSLMYPANVGSPESTTGAANTAKTASADCGRPRRSGAEAERQPSPIRRRPWRRPPGAVSSAVASARVRNWPTQMIAASPQAGINAGASSRPVIARTKRPQPPQSASSSAGKTTQATARSIGQGIVDPDRAAAAWAARLRARYSTGTIRPDLASSNARPGSGS